MDGGLSTVGLYNIETRHFFGHCFWIGFRFLLTMMESFKVLAILSFICSSSAFTPLVGKASGRQQQSVVCRAQFNTEFMWNAGLNFGKGEFKFYEGFLNWMSPFPDEDKEAYPEIFNFPEGLYEVRLPKPLGIVFEEIQVGKGVYVQDLVPGGNAATEGTTQKNDILVGITAVKVVGAKYERRLIPARNFSFETMVGAVESNEPRFNCNDVILVMERPGEANSEEVQKFMEELFEPPVDNPWKQRQ